MLGLQIAVTPPHPPPPPRELLASTPFEEVLRQRWGPMVVKCLCWVIALFEVVVIAASYFPDRPWTSRIISVLAKNGNVDRIYVSPMFIIGVSLTLAGAFLRYWCFRELGNLFTFEVSIREDHRLVQTGPYHLVRHPGYTGVLLSVAGVVCWNACPGSWLRECGALETKVGLSAVIAFGVLVAVIIAGLLLRMSKEDEALERCFGRDWVAWSLQVPYKLVPGLF
ncbi:hypothetical protein GGX14DRAFT_630272 [Mycena pura]|uniref:Protein-S-isoprenylcysteine O-methyltransferase n=1 Tax=Mycena pura TaxID=153505 RepID=A0AAD6VGS6_9AGAR|nr:hypothetical protein GGX14DRAFT_630272 [Mycena pura]